MPTGRLLSSFWKWGAAGALMAGAAVVGVTFALADGSQSATTYYACVNNSSGTIKMMSATDTCHSNETKIQWNQAGAAGPAGDPGPKGDPGASGSSAAYVARTGVRDFQTFGAGSSLVVAELEALPAGSYTVNAQETTSFPDANEGGEVTCTLTPGGAHAIEGAEFSGIGSVTQAANVVVTDGITVGEGAVVKYTCNGPANLSSDNAVITATRVDTLTDQTIAAPAGAGTMTAAVGAALPSKPGTCSLTVSGTSLMPGWAIYYLVNGGGHFPFTELDGSGNAAGVATAAMDGSLNATTAIGYPPSGSWTITLLATGADGAAVTATVYSSAACDGAQ